jgi:hypothetical protein
MALVHHVNVGMITPLGPDMGSRPHTLHVPAPLDPLKHLPQIDGLACPCRNGAAGSPNLPAFTPKPGHEPIRTHHKAAVGDPLNISAVINYTGHAHTSSAGM